MTRLRWWGLSRFFKTAPGQYGEGDKFLGIKVPVTREVVKACWQFIRHGQLDDTYAIADIFLDKRQPLHNLLQKAVGWLLRDAGKRDEGRLRRYLEANRGRMPRTMLPYAIEKFTPEERLAILKS